MKIINVVLIIVLVISFIYIFVLEKQIRAIRNQLEQRYKNNTQQPLSVELLNRELSSLVSNINQSLELGQCAIAENKHKEKELKNMIASLSHDLRTPLTAIKGNMQLIEQGEINSDQRQKIGIVKRHIEEMSQLVDSFWEYSYLSVSEIEIKFEKINITNIVAECVADYVHEFEKKGIVVFYKQEKPLLVYSDKGYMIRIINNLIQNCIKYSDGDVIIEFEQLSDRIILSVKNIVREGNDIDIYHIFDRFYTEDKARKKAAGLGLSVVSLLSEKMGGRSYATLEKNTLGIHVEFMIFKNI
ncbi:sensor histidine kinase [Peptostreptococcus faecalis]|uniref:sensor histidine kinase n=1 Tax=Peptostreptococcus faecalis TaxID=2045015 RepID=UPI000C7C3D58|nr:HAMP domain-containing sensor histidine kinase [Peptostreptococcus faecalis]